MFALMILTSCTKTYCWKCQIQELEWPISTEFAQVGEATICDKTELEIRQYQKDALKTTKVKFINGEHIITRRTICNK